MENNTKNYLSVPFEKKEYAKNKGCKWDASLKKWYILNDNKHKEELLIEFPINIKKFNSYKEQQSQLKKNLQEDENNPKCIMCYDECLKYFNYCYDCYRRNKNPEEYL
jgi:hypothetical protein